MTDAVKKEKANQCNNYSFVFSHFAAGFVLTNLANLANPAKALYLVVGLL